MSNRNQKIREGIAKALFASAWADLQDEYETGAIGPGTEVMDVMPDDIAEAAYAAAGEILSAFQDLNGEFSAAHLHDAVLSKIKDPEMFGHYIGMQAMGHGVGLTDYDIHYEVPYHEFNSHNLDIDIYVNHQAPTTEEEPEADSPSP